MSTLEKLRALDPIDLLTAGLLLCFFVVCFEAFSRSVICRRSSSQSQLDSCAKNQNADKPSLPIRIAFITLQWTVLGTMLLMRYAPERVAPISDWLRLLLILAIPLTLLSSSIFINRDRVLARCGFAVVGLALVAAIFAKA